MRWQKAARLAIVAFVIVFAGIVLVTMRRRAAAPETVAEITRGDEEAVVENPGGANYSRTEGGKLVSRIVSKRHYVYADGRQRLEDNVEITLPDRHGKTVVIRADKAELTKASEKELGAAVFNGNLRLTTDDGLEVLADAATYDDASGVITVPGPVEFTRGRMKGRGVGATYDNNRDVLWLRDQAHITVAPGSDGQGAADATAGAAGLARAENYVKLTRNARIVSDGRTITADEVTALLGEDGDTIDQVQLRGNSRITESGANARNMSAHDIDLAYGPDGRTLQRALLMENAVVDLPGVPGAGRRVGGRTIDMTMGPDGTTLTTLDATDNVQLDLPAQGDKPAKQIRAQTLRASGPAETGLRHAAFDGEVEYRETRDARGGTAAIDRTARSQRLTIATRDGLGEIEQADFRGRFRFTDGTAVTAEAPRALYHVNDDRIDLSPYEQEPGPTPFVNDGQVLVEAVNIQLAPSTRKLAANTDVKSTVQPKRRDGADARSADSKMPVMLKQDRPVYVASNRLIYDGIAEATYTGNARLWQDQSQSKIDAGTIILDDRTGNLTARTGVRTSMLMEDVDPQTKQKTVTPTVATSDLLVYDEAKRLAVYTGTAERQAHMKGVHGDVTADRIDVYLQESGNQLERAEAHGTVTVKEGARTAKGQELVYTSANDTYVMKGSPVEAIEREAPNSCKKIVGTVLTFQRSVGSISADANSTTLVKSEPIPCPPGSRN